MEKKSIKKSYIEVKQIDFSVLALLILIYSFLIRLWFFWCYNKIHLIFNNNGFVLGLLISLFDFVLMLMVGFIISDYFKLYKVVKYEVKN